MRWLYAPLTCGVVVCGCVVVVRVSVWSEAGAPSKSTRLLDICAVRRYASGSGHAHHDALVIAPPRAHVSSQYGPVRRRARRRSSVQPFFERYNHNHNGVIFRYNARYTLYILRTIQNAHTVPNPCGCGLRAHYYLETEHA